MSDLEVRLAAALDQIQALKADILRYNPKAGEIIDMIESGAPAFGSSTRSDEV